MASQSMDGQTTVAPKISFTEDCERSRGLAIGQPITFLCIILGMVGSSYHFTGDLEQLQYQTLPVQSNISIPPPQEAMLRRSWSI